MGSLRSVKSFSGYKINGCRFSSMSYGSYRPSPNCGVCVKGSNYVNGESYYFGWLVETKCWYKNPSKYPSLVVVNDKRRYNENDIFVLAAQATQVYYINYPSLKRDKQDCLAVTKIKARAILDIPISNNVESESTSDPYQDDELESHPIHIVTSDESELLIDDSTTELNIVDVKFEDDSNEDKNENEYFDLTEDD
ncbi:hypothetical protein V6N11_071306 [Hibiscus sabdariffa]|uniref:DUF4216 domain-containing protein n=1 Tax=Hibiscus sabdariffa TaxID=183260 RepID=A0ABR2U0J0_9ROSI